jgi:hypothetical protein
MYRYFYNMEAIYKISFTGDEVNAQVALMRDTRMRTAS